MNGTITTTPTMDSLPNLTDFFHNKYARAATLFLRGEKVLAGQICHELVAAFVRCALSELYSVQD